MIYLYLFGTCFHFIYVFMIIYQVNGKIITFDNIAGPWTVLEYTGTHLVMEAYNPNKMVWTLEKMY